MLAYLSAFASDFISIWFRADRSRISVLEFKRVILVITLPLKLLEIDEDQSMIYYLRASFMY